METKNFDNQDTNEVEATQITDKGLEMNPSGNLENSSENTLDNQYDAISNIQENAKKALADLKKNQEEIEKIEITKKFTQDSIDQIKEQELGLPKETGEIPSLRNMIKRGQELVKEKAKLIAFLTATGFLTLANTGEATAQTNKTVDKNPEKTETSDLNEIRQKNIDKWISENYDLFKAGKFAAGTIKEGPDGKNYRFGAELDKDVFKLKKSGESIDGPDNVSMKEINISSFFKTGTVEYIDADSEARAMQSVRDFLDSIDDLENSTIKVMGTYSIDRPWGDISPEHPHGDKNTEIAEARKQVCLGLLNKVLKEKYNEEQIAKISIESIAKGIALSHFYTEDEISKMTEEERNHNIDKLQGLFLDIVKNLVKQTEEVGLNEGMKEYLNAVAVIIDESNSMKDDAKEVKKIIEEVNAQNKDQVKTITLEGGNNEAHLKTLKNVLAGLDSSAFGKNIILVTDEFDESTNSYDKDVEEILEMAEKLGINIIIKVSDLNIYKNRPKGETITVNLKYMKDILKPETEIPGKTYVTKEDLKEATYQSKCKKVKAGGFASK